MAQKMNGEQVQEEIRKMAAQQWHEEALLEQASKKVFERQLREQLEQQKRTNEKKVNNATLLLQTCECSIGVLSLVVGE